MSLVKRAFGCGVGAIAGGVVGAALMGLAGGAIGLCGAFFINFFGGLLAAYSIINPWTWPTGWMGNALYDKLGSGGLVVGIVAGALAGGIMGLDACLPANSSMARAAR
jgi:hypothetical protein